MAVKREVNARPVPFNVRRPDPTNSAAGQLAQGLSSLVPALAERAARLNQEAFNRGAAARLSTEDIEKAVADGKIAPWETPHFERGFVQESGRQAALKARNAAIEQYETKFDPETDDLNALLGTHFNVRGVKDQDFLAGYTRIAQATEAELLNKYNEDRISITQNKTNTMAFTTLASAVQTALTGGRHLSGQEIDALYQDLRQKFPGYMTKQRFNALLVEAVTQTGESAADVRAYGALREKISGGKVPALVDNPKFTDKIVSSEIAALNRSIQIENREWTLSERRRGVASRRLQAHIAELAVDGNDVSRLVQEGLRYDLIDESFVRTVDAMRRRDPVVEHQDRKAELYRDLYGGALVSADIWTARANEEINNATFKDMLAIYERLSDPTNSKQSAFLRDPAVKAEIDQFTKRFDRGMLAQITSFDSARRSNAIRDLYRRITEEAGGSLAKVRQIVDEEKERWFPKDVPDSLPSRPILFDSMSEKTGTVPTIQELSKATLEAIEAKDPRLAGRKGEREMDYLRRLLEYERVTGTPVQFNPEEDRL